MQDHKEKLYVDFDAEDRMWGVFGEDSGKCYVQYYTETEANEALERRQGIGVWNLSQLRSEKKV